jgi:hypothetical protein
MDRIAKTHEGQRLKAHYRENNGAWMKWGPYLSERQWGTVREDYSEYGNAWEFFPHDHARSRVYRWGEDGLAGISDEMQRLCFAVALWNGRDPILKERLFGHTGNEGNHGEDVKELYYYLDGTPTHSYMKHLYKYPQRAFPYADLAETNRRRSRHEPEYELLDTGVFGDNRYFDVFTEYAKAAEEDLYIRITVYNRGAEAAPITVLPTLWFRNLWSFGLLREKPSLILRDIGEDHGHIEVRHFELGNYHFYFQKPDAVLFTENETNTERLFQTPNASPFVKDAFHRAVVGNDYTWLLDKKQGTKAAPMYQRSIPGGGYFQIKLRLAKAAPLDAPLGAAFERVFAQRIGEADTFYAAFIPAGGDADLANIQRQAFAGMLWTKQYYNLDIPRWLDGDPGQVPPPPSRENGRNHEWHTLNNEDIISMPDKWEYPWYAAWDLAFHCVPLAMINPDFAKNQLILFLREWYMRPNGQIPAYEWAFSDVNPPVHAWACLQVYKLDEARAGKGDLTFLKRVFSKLTLNFTWWVNRKDTKGNNVFEGGFLGLDNIGVFDRSNYIPGGGHLEQADGTSWMAMYCLNLLEMALIIAAEDEAYEDVATKFFEHFVYIAESLNRIGKDWTGAWDEAEGFFYDILALPDGRYIPLKVRSLVGLSTLFACLTITKELLEKVPDFRRRLNWFVAYRAGLVDYKVVDRHEENADLLLALTPPERLRRLLQAMLDEEEFLSPAGIRSVSRVHRQPYVVHIDGQEYGLTYEPGESSNHLFGGNSNWRGPVWMPMNYLLIQSLREYHRYFGDNFQVEYPSRGGRMVSLAVVADELCRRLVSTFRRDESGRRPVHGEYDVYALDPHFKELVLFYEYFHGDNGRGVGASHQTGWTGLIAALIDQTCWGTSAPKRHKSVASVNGRK